MAEWGYGLEEGAEPGSTPPVDGVRIGSGLTDENGDPFGLVISHCEDGKTKNLAQYKGKPRFEALLCVFLDQAQLIEDAFWQLYTERTLEAAYGVVLEYLGAIVGEPRKDRVDDIYRQFIRVRILVNRSNGKLEELYAIIVKALAALDGSGPVPVVSITQQYPASITVEISSDSNLEPTELAILLHKAKGGGIRLNFVMSFSSMAESFTFDTVPAGTSIDQGFGSTTDPTWGGDLSSAFS